MITKEEVHVLQEVIADTTDDPPSVHLKLHWTGGSHTEINVSKYRTSITYQQSGERIQIVGTRPNGQSCNTIENLSGAYAWTHSHNK